MAAADNRSRIKEEEKRVTIIDKTHETERVNMKLEERWEIELRDAFEVLGTVDPLANIEALKNETEPPPLQLGKHGFRRLLVDGKLLNMSQEDVDEVFSAVDQDGSGLISFEEMWVWFVHEARRRSKKKLIKFTVSNIISVRQRAIIVIMRRYLSQSGSGL